MLTLAVSHLHPPQIICKAVGDKLARMMIAEHEDWLALNKPAGLAVQGGSLTTRHIDGLLRAAYPEPAQTGSQAG